MDLAALPIDVVKIERDRLGGSESVCGHQEDGRVIPRALAAPGIDRPHEPLHIPPLDRLRRTIGNDDPRTDHQCGQLAADPLSDMQKSQKGAECAATAGQRFRNHPLPKCLDEAVEVARAGIT
jgi:hypothetical protein